MPTLEYRFQVRGGLKEALLALDEVPLRRELVVELDNLFTTGEFDAKIGDGVTTYSALPYLQVSGGGSGGGVSRPPGNAYTVAATDDGYTLVSADATGFALTLPLNATVAIPVGAKIAYTQGAAGPITVTGSAGVTVRAPNGNMTGALFDGGVAEKIGTDEWQLWNGPALGALATATDAPSNGTPYSRQSGGWVPASSASGSGITAMNEQTGTSYALVLTDATKGVRMTNAAACTLTIPTNATTAIPVLSGIPVFQGGAGKVTIVAATGVTLESPNGVATTGVGDFRTIFQRAANVWVIG